MLTVLFGSGTDRWKLVGQH